MANPATLLLNWPGIGDPGNVKFTLDALTYAANILDQRSALLNTSGVPTIPAPSATYTLLTLPTAATYPGRIIIVSDASTANTACISNGTDWKIITLGATVS